MAISRPSNTVLDPSVPGGDTVKEAITKNSDAVDSIITQTNSEFGDYLASANNLSDVADSDTSLDNLGGTTTGKAVFKATDAASGRTALDSGTVGDNVFIADTSAAAQQAMDVEVGVDVQAYDADILKADTADTIASGVGYGNTNSAASNPPTPLEGQMQDLTMTSATELALMTVKGFVSLRVTGAYALTFASGWEVIGEYDNTIAEANVDLKFDGTTCWAWITNASA